MNIDLMFSSKNDDWETPQDLFDKLNNIYHFTLDPCSTHENTKCAKHYTKAEDGLIQDWTDEVVFMNPPYSKPDKKTNSPGQIAWVKKAYEESLKGAIVVCLLPARTDTQLFHRYCLKGKITFIEGRLKFSGYKDAAPFPSMIVVFGAGQ